MQVRAIFKHILEVTISNISTILSGIVIGFILPKIISVEGYGFYKTFTLYVTYLGLFSLGMIDGIVLDYGGVDYEKIDRPLFRCYFRWYIAIHFFFATLIAFSSILVGDADTKFIILMLSANLLAVNISGYFQNISQITQRFREYSLRKILQSILNVLVVILMFIAYNNKGELDYKLYVVALVLINLSLTIWYVVTYRDIVFGRADRVQTKIKEVLHLVKIGFPLLFANLCSTLILTLDRQFVNFLFDTKTYAVYAFAYSMLALVTVATSAIATVLYPTLKRTTSETMKHTYPALVTTLMVIVFGFVIIYFPLKWFIVWFLPKYSDSLEIFRVIFPGLGISSIITVIIHNYYKALGRNLEYFKKSIVVIAFSALANVIAYLIFKTTISISVASIITMVLWYLYLDAYFRKEYDYNWRKIFAYLMSMIICFYVATAIKSDLIGLMFYIIAYISLTILLFKHDMKNMIEILHLK